MTKCIEGEMSSVLEEDQTEPDRLNEADRATPQAVMIVLSDYTGSHILCITRH
jgi:hypothetical protein